MAPMITVTIMIECGKDDGYDVYAQHQKMRAPVWS
jgi:hypothetical protein